MGPRSESTVYDLQFAVGLRQPIRKSSIVNRKSLQAYRRHGARIDANAAIDAVVRVHLCLATDHADRAARALADTAFTSGALAFVDFCGHPQPLSKNDL